MAYEELEPAWEEKLSFQLALLTATLVNVVQGALGGSKTKMLQPKDFLPEWDPEKGGEPVIEQTTEEMKKTLLEIFKANKPKRPLQPPKRRVKK